MNAIDRLFSFLLCATTAMLWLLASAYAQSKDTKLCAILAGGFGPNISMQITAADKLHQMVESKIYAACLQTRRKQGASRMTAPGHPGTNTTNADTFVAFDVPGSSSTNPTAINNPGAITGYFADAGSDIHSFLRTSDDTITPFDPPGTTCNSTDSFCSLAVGITPDGTIVGETIQVHQIHGYLRAPNGAFTLFDPPLSNFTNPLAIKPDGTVTGNFVSSTGGAGSQHGFLRAPNGTFTMFDPLGSTSAAPTAINPAGTVTGSFVDVRGVPHGFLRTSGGTITTFDASPNSPETDVAGINPAGTIVGDFFFLPDLSEHGFLRAPNGTITMFDPPGSGLTIPTAINPAGAIVGLFFTPDFSAEHGFLRAPNGTITVFDPPGSALTRPTAINPAGTVTGWFTSDFLVIHGFVGRPKNMH